MGTRFHRTKKGGGAPLIHDSFAFPKPPTKPNSHRLAKAALERHQAAYLRAPRTIKGSKGNLRSPLLVDVRQGFGVVEFPYQCQARLAAENLGFPPWPVPALIRRPHLFVSLDEGHEWPTPMLFLLFLLRQRITETGGGSR